MADDDDDDEDVDISTSTGAGDWSQFPLAQPQVAQQPADDWSRFPLVQQAGGQGGQDDWSQFPLVSQQQQPKAESPFWTTLRHVAHGLLPSAAGLAAIPGGIAAGAAIGLPEAGIGAIPGAFIGGGLAYMGARAAQDTGAKLLGFGDDQQMAADDAANPKSAVVGDILSAAPFLGPGAAPGAVRAGGALFGAGMEAFNQWKSGESPDWSRLAIAGAGGALMTTPTRAGEAIGSRAAAAIGRPELWHGTPGSDAAAGTAKEQPPPPAGAPREGGAATATPETTAPAGDRGGAEDYGKDTPPAAERQGVNVGETDPALAAAIRAKMEPGGEPAAPPPEQPTTPAGAAEPEIPTATSAKLEAQFPRVAPGVEGRPLTGEPAAPVQPAQPPAAAQAAIANSKGFSVRWNPDEFQFEAVSKDGKVIGHLLDAMPEKGTPENPAFTAGAEVDEPWRRKGVASALYDAFAAKHDGNIAPAGNTSREAWDFWLKKYPDKTADYVKQQAADIAANARSGNFDPEAFTDQSIRDNYDHPKIQDMIIKELRSAAPATPSVAAEPQAQPLTEAAATLYHGTNQQFADFDPAQLQRSSGSYDAAHGFYFTDDPEVASFFADSPKNGRIIEARLDFKNPKTIKLDPSDNTLDKNASIKEAFAAGHDAVIFKGSSEGKGPVTTTYVVPRTDQINQIASYPTAEALQRARTPREAIEQRAPGETVTSEPSTDPLQQRINEATAAPSPAAHLRETAAMYREQGQEGSARRLEQGADAIERSQQQQQQQQRQQPPRQPPGGPPKPPTVGQAAAAGGGKLPPGPTSMAYAPPQNRSNLSKLWRSMKLLVGSDIGPYGRLAENIIRGAYGRAKRVFEQTMNLLNPHMETVRNMGPMDRAALNNRVEGGNDFPNWQPTPDQQRIIDVYKPAMDLWKDQFSRLDRTAQMKFVNDYLAHMYKNPAQASEFFSQFGKRGGAGSTKGRTHATYEDAKKAGLEPLTDNPIEIATRYGLSMTNFLASNDALERAVETGVVGYFNSGKSVGATGSPEPHQVGGPPPGWKKLNAPPKGPFLEAYAPEDFADKYNAFYSQGLRGVHAPIYDALRSANAGWTMMELGLNAYHFFTMANEGIISDVKRGLDQIFTGQIKEGAKTIAGAPLAPGTRYIEGKRFQREYLDPNSTNPIASIMAEANARPVGRGHAYDILGSAGDENISRGSFIKNFDKDKINSQLKQAWDDVKDDWGLADSVGKQAMFPFKQASRVLQTVGAPLFDKYIPALKAGAMHSQMADWLAANPHIDINTPAGRQAAVEMAMKISDGVDNGFGEMVHDNLFMNQTLRHAAMVAMRSFSWSLGAMRQIGGGTYAAGKAGVLSLKTGENRFSMAHPEFDPRISYAIAFPFVVATISAIYQGLRAGEAPQDWRDLYAPRTGGTVPGLGGKGQVPEHALMPGFQKDVYGWLSHPLREAYAKLGGLPTTALEQITNRDWRGDPIAQRGASPIDQFQQRMAHLFSKLGPIGARAIAKGQPETSGITPVETALGFRAPGVDIQDPVHLEKWLAAQAKKEWKGKERHDKTEQRKYARERTYDPQEREQQPQ